ncbi:hypothetical protein IWZ00DRAFT_258395 [Phyllosticta capitalensis]
MIFVRDMRYPITQHRCTCTHVFSAPPPSTCSTSAAPFCFSQGPVRSSFELCSLAPPTPFPPSGLPRYCTWTPSQTSKKREQKDARNRTPALQVDRLPTESGPSTVKYRQAIALEARCVVWLFKSKPATGAGHVFNSARHSFFCSESDDDTHWLLLQPKKAQHVLVRTRTWDGSRESGCGIYVTTTPTLLLLERVACAGAVGEIGEW